MRLRVDGGWRQRCFDPECRDFDFAVRPLPPEVLAVVGRQQDSVTTQVRRRHGQRLAEQRKADGYVAGFSPAMRAKALATRKAKAAKRQARRQRKEVA